MSESLAINKVYCRRHRPHSVTPFCEVMTFNNAKRLRKQHFLFFLVSQSLQKVYKIGTIISFILWTRILKAREVGKLTYVHRSFKNTASESMFTATTTLAPFFIWGTSLL